MPDDEIRFVGNLQRLELRPGDAFVLSVQDYLTADQASRLHAMWREFCATPEGTPTPRLLVLDGGVQLGVVNTEGTPHG